MSDHAMLAALTRTIPTVGSRLVHVAASSSLQTHVTCVSSPFMLDYGRPRNLACEARDGGCSVVVAAAVQLLTYLVGDERPACSS